MQRNGTRRIAGVVAASAAALAVLVHLRAPPPRDHVFLVTLDTTRADHLGAYGSTTALTPTLDALAADGVVFTDAHAATPLTLPSHATMLTGLLPPEHGVHLNGREALPAGIPTLAEALGSQGYETAAFVGAFVLDADFGLARGFEVYDDAVPAMPGPDRLAASRPGNAVVDAALAWLDAYVRRHGDGRGAMRPDAPPVFCWIHLFDAHRPYRVHPELDGTAFAGHATYDAQIAFVDRQLARLMQYLDAHGLRDRALLVIVGDHGEGLGDHGESEHGYQLYDETMRVPLLIRVPHGRTRGLRASAVVSTVDVARTVLDLVGVSPDAVGGGRSLRAALDGGHLDDEAVYGETDLPFTTFGWSPLRSLTARRWKYVRTTKPELYDREADPREATNLFEARADTARELDAALSTMEGAFVRRSAPRVALSGVDVERLRALGYLADAAPSPPPDPNQSLPDVKDMLPVKDREAELTARMAAGTITDAEIVTTASALVARSPGTAGFHQTLGSALLRLGRLDEAVVALEEATRLRPDFAEAHADLAAAHMGLHQEAEAEREFAVALQLKPDLPEAHVGSGNLAASRNELEAAVAHYHAALRSRPAYVEAHLNLAHTLARLGRPDAAVVEYRETLRLRPDLRPAYEGLLPALVQQGDTAAALAEARTLVTASPQDAWRHYLLGRLAARYGDAREALLHLVEADRIAPDQAQYRGAVARLLATTNDSRVGDRTRALALAQRAVALSPHDPVAKETLAVAYAGRGAFGRATQVLDDAITVAAAQGQVDLVRELEARAALYRARRIVRD